MKELRELICKKKIVLIVVLAEILFVAVYGAVMIARYSAQEEVCFTETDMQLLTSDGKETQGCYTDTSFEDVKAVATPAFRPGKGIYYIQIFCKGYGIIKGGLIYDEPRNGKEIVDNNEFYVNSDPGWQKTPVRVRINDDSAVRFRVRLTGDAVEGDYVQLSEIHIIPSRLSYVYRIFGIVILFLAIDLCAWGYDRYYQSWNQKQKMVFGILAVTAFIGGLPLYQPGLMPAKDLVFHLQRIEGLSQGILAGDFPVRIQPGWLEGHGYAASVFYGDIFLYIPAVMRLVGFTVEEAYKFYLQLVNLAAVLIAFFSFRKITKDDVAAAAGSILYTGSLYWLDCLHKAKVGRCSAMAFYPLVAAGFYLLFTEDTDSREYKRIWGYLTAGFTGLLMTHMLSGLMAAIYAVLACLLMVKRVLRKNTIIELLKAAGAFVLINLWYLVPFLSYMFSEKLHVNSGMGDKIGKDIECYL